MIKAIITLMFSIYLVNINATAQQPDIIIIDDAKYALNTNPLEEILETRKIKSKPDFDSSGNWRGYIADWEIKDDKFLLKDVTISKYSMFEKRLSVLNEIFPDKEKGLLAYWYSGALIIPFGELINYQHMGYGSTYENYLILKIKEGIVFERLEMKNDDFNKYKKEKFEKFKQTEKYKEEYNKLLNENWKENESESFLNSFYSEYYLSL